MEDVEKKLLLEVDVRAQQVDVALREMVKLASQIDILKGKRTEEASVNGKLSASYIEMGVEIRGLQKQYNTLQNFIVKNDLAESALSSTLARSSTTLASYQAEMNQLTIARQALTEEERRGEGGQGMLARINQLTALLAEEGTTLEKNKLSVGGYKQAISEVINETDKEASKVVVTSKAYQDLLIDYQKATAEAQEYYLTLGKESPEFKNAMASMGDYKNQLNGLRSSMGQYSKSTVNANYSTFALTQVMREAPNFAIDMRLGFMALSNNLPILGDSFRQLAKSTVYVKDATGALVEKQLGSIGALKAFAASLLSLNTIMVLLSTVLIAFGPQIKAWWQNLRHGADAVDSTKIRLNALQEVMKDKGGSAKQAIAKMAELKIVLDRAKEGTYDANAAVKTYNETLGKHYGKVTNVTDAMAGYIRHSSDYVKSMLAQAAALKLVDQTAEAMITKQNAQENLGRIKNINQLRDAYSDLYTLAKSKPGGLEYLSSLFSGKGSTGRLGDLRDVSLGFIKLMQLSNGTEFRKNMESIFASDEKIKATDKAINSLYKDISGDQSQSNGVKPVKILTDVTSAFNPLEGKLKEVQTELYNIASEVERFGVKTKSEERVKAAKAWLDNELRIAKADYEVSVSYENKKYVLDLERLKQQRDSQEDQKAAMVEYNKGVEVLSANHNNALVKLGQDYNNRQVEASREVEQLLYKIGQDKVAEEIRQANEKSQRIETEIEQARSQAVKEENIRYEGLVSQAKNNKDRQILAKEHKANLSFIDATYNSLIEDNEVKLLERLLELEGLSDSDRLALQTELAKKRLEIEKKNSKDRADNEEADLEESIARTKRAEEAKQRIMEDVLSAASDMVSTYYDTLAQKAEDNKNIELQELEDKKNKGLLTEKEYEARKKSINKKAFEDEKKLKKQQATIAMLLGIVRIWSENGINPIVAAAESALLAATTAMSIKAINATKYVAARGALLQGPSHSQGGITVNAEGGETIINKKSSALFRPLLSAINQAGGGIRFADGGMVGLSNDGGFGARLATGYLGFSLEQLTKAFSKIHISVAVDQIEKARTQYALVKSRASV